MKSVAATWAVAAWIVAALPSPGASKTLPRIVKTQGQPSKVAVMSDPHVLSTEADSAQVLAIVRHLADPALEGRGPGTAGIDSAAAYLAGEMERIGLTPGGEEGSYFQPMEVTTGVAVGSPCAIEGQPIGQNAGQLSSDKTRYDSGEHMQPLGFSTNGTLKAPLVFAGYGITAPGYGYDDYAGIDVHDKIVLVMTNEPGEMDSTSKFDGSVNTPHAELRTKAINAREHGALAMIVVNGPRYHDGEPVPAPRTEGSGYMSSGLLAEWVSDEVCDRLLMPEKQLAYLQELIDQHERPQSRALTRKVSGVDLPESVTVTVTLKRTRTTIKNVIGWIPGGDTTRTLVIGAHYDHLGYGNENSLAPESHVPHVGADDNASGVAALLDVARHASERARAGHPPTHDLVFCAFTGEEMGLVGSSHFVDDPTRPLETIEAMLNMDMVGRLKDGKLMVMGVGTAAEFPALIAHANQATSFTIKTSSDGYGPSDHSSFYKKDVPVLMLFTGAHADYHKPTDTWDKINAPGLARVASYMTALVESLDARPRVHYTKAKSDSTTGRIAGGGGYGAYLGTIPDYMKTEGGVLLSGVRTGAPAAAAGIQGGDTIIKFDGVRIDNIYDYTYALRSRKPGQQVRITVLRGGQEVDLLATLGRRP